MKQYVVDVFTETVFHGNPTAVCFVEDWPDDELKFRGRGRPRLPADMKRREKMVITLTEEEFQQCLTAAAAGGFRKVQDWARDMLLKKPEAIPLEETK